MRKQVVIIAEQSYKLICCFTIYLLQKMLISFEKLTVLTQK